MKIGIKIKIIGPLILIMVIAVIIMAVAYYNLRELHQVEEKSASLFFEFAAVSLIDTALARQDAPVHDFLISGDRDEKKDYDRFVTETDRRIKNVKKDFKLTGEEKAIVARVEELQAKIKSDAAQIFSLTNPVGNKSGTAVMKDLDEKREIALNELDKFHEIDRQEISSARRHALLIRAGQNSLIIGLLIIAFIVLIFIYLVTKYISRPLLALHRAVEQISQGNLNTRVDLHTRDELEDLSTVFNEMAFNLNQEQQMAAKIQRRLLPWKQPRIPGINLHARQSLAKIVGGDWYDYYTLGDDLVILIADASGKGMPGAMLSTVTMTTMRSEPKTEIPLIDLLIKTNKTVVSRLAAGDFVTLFIARLNVINHELRYVNCGQEPPLYFHHQNNCWSTLKTLSGLPIGISETLFQPKMENLRLKKGDRLILYTDGLHDIRNSEGQFFSLELAIAWLNNNKELPLSSLIDGLLNQAITFGASQILDDITMLGVEISE